MTTSFCIRHVLHISACASFLFLVIMIARVVDARCPEGRFGRGCKLSCRCQGAEPCNIVTGKCPGNCSEGWSGPNCQRQNVALGMPTEMKTTSWTRGDLAVDGNLKTCVTSSSNRTGWWRVDLLSSRLVYFMEIHLANKHSPGRIRVHISDYVDTFWGKPCTRLPISHKRSKFTCDIQSTGRYFGLINKQGQITVCEVSVYVCSLYTFGEFCSRECGCADPQELCNPVTGACLSGCRDGWIGTNCSIPCTNRYGPSCRNPCGHCYGGYACDQVSGVCHQGCAPGWQGARCLQACEPGSYGVSCAHSCGHCLDQATCDAGSGHCPWRCQPGWSGSRCDTECSPGVYGQNCDFTCGHCRNGSSCLSSTGVCPQGCEPGFQGLFCTKGCLSGRWGMDCRQTCGHCSLKQCHNVTGDCDTSGCQAGWSGPRCDTECVAGTYGANCSDKCGQCLGKCSPVNGLCPVACRPGWTGSKCLDKCSNHTYGQNCALQCGHCSEGQQCHHETGHCPGSCARGYHTRLCHIHANRFSLTHPNLLAMLIGCMIVFTASVMSVFTCLLVRWRRDNQHGVVDKHPQPYKQTVV